jgi:DNA polymerase III subunit beta
MKITVLQENLLQALKQVRRVVPSKPQLPILSSILLEVKDQTIMVSATDLYTGIRARVQGVVEGEGSIAIPAAVFADMTSTLSGGQLELEASETSLKVTSQGSVSTIPVFPAADFPPFPDKDGDQIKISKTDLNEVVELVALACAKDDSRPALTAVLLKFGEQTHAVATDGFRLAVLGLPNQVASDPEAKLSQVLIPAAALREIHRLSSSIKSEFIELSISSKMKQMFCTVDDVELVIRLMDGDFPPYEKVMPAAYTTQVILDGEQLQQQLKGALVFARDSSNIVTFTITDQDVQLAATSAAAGTHQSSMPGKLVSGAGGTIAFNALYLQDFLASAKPKTVLFGMNESLQPALFRPEGRDEYHYIVMPFRTTNS